MFSRLVGSLWRVGVTVAVVGAVLMASVAVAEAQLIGQPGVRHIRSITPTSGPIGTEVHIWTDGLPRNVRVSVAIGEQHGCGYQVCGTVQTNARGELTATVEAPDWGHWDHFEVVMVLNEEFVPIASSDPFHVTNADGLVQRAGLVATAWPGCPSLRSTDGLDYALVGDHALTLLATIGKEVIVEGRMVPGTCNLQNAIEVVSVDVPPVG